MEPRAAGEWERTTFELDGEQTFLWYFQCCFWHFMEQYLTDKQVEQVFVPTLVQPYLAQTMISFSGD